MTRIEPDNQASSEQQPTPHIDHFVYTLSTLPGWDAETGSMVNPSGDRRFVIDPDTNSGHLSLSYKIVGEENNLTVVTAEFGEAPDGISPEWIGVQVFADDEYSQKKDTYSRWYYYMANMPDLAPQGAIYKGASNFFQRDRRPYEVYDALSEAGVYFYKDLPAKIYVEATALELLQQIESGSFDIPRLVSDNKTHVPDWILKRFYTYRY